MVTGSTKVAVKREPSVPGGEILPEMSPYSASPTFVKVSLSSEEKAAGKATFSSSLIDRAAIAGKIEGLMKAEKAESSSSVEADDEGPEEESFAAVFV